MAFIMSSISLEEEGIKWSWADNVGRIKAGSVKLLWTLKETSLPATGMFQYLNMVPHLHEHVEPTAPEHTWLTTTEKTDRLTLPATV